MQDGVEATARGESRRRLLLLLIVCVALVLFVFARGRIQFNWSLFLQKLRFASPIHLATAVLLIFSTNWIRSVRWALFLRPVRRVPPFSLVGAQLMGFSAVALFGRIADLTRPYLISRRVGLPLASQIATYTIERIFDLGGVAFVFSMLLFLTPRGAPHHEVFVRTGLLAFAGMAFLGFFAFCMWHSGEQVAGVVESLVGRVSKAQGSSVAQKLLSFRDGLNTLRSAREVGAASMLSILMWALIAEAYVQTAHAFLRTPTLGSLTLVTAMPLLAASMGGSLLQLPVIGWFTQIAITAAAMHRLYRVPVEDATACGAVLLIVNTLSVIPLGLLYSRIEGISLQDASRSPGREQSAGVPKVYPN